MKSLPSIKKLKFSLFLIILMSCVYIILNEVIRKNRTFDIECIVKWGGKIDKIAFLNAKN